MALILYWPYKIQMLGTAFHFPTTLLKRRPIISLFKHHTLKTSFITVASSASASSSAAAVTAAVAAASVTTMQHKKLTEDGVYIVNQMPPPLPELLNNSYYLLRHGQSFGNVEMVISSARSLAKSEKHGLTLLGHEQGKESAKNLLDLLKEKQNT